MFFAMAGTNNKQFEHLFPNENPKIFSSIGILVSCLSGFQVSTPVRSRRASDSKTSLTLPVKYFKGLYDKFLKQRKCLFVFVFLFFVFVIKRLWLIFTYKRKLNSQKFVSMANVIILNNLSSIVYLRK